MKLKVNVVSQIPPFIWDRELPQNLPWHFFHSAEPEPADVHVIYGIRSKLLIPNKLGNVVFVASEPPEIRKYNARVLRRYGHVLGPSYAYLSGLANFSAITAIAPWWVGVKAGGQHHYESADGTVNMDRRFLENGVNPQHDIVTAVVSQKARTPLQEQRLRLVDYLQARLEVFEVFGLGSRQVEDKADVLRTNRYHLAVENSCHAGYWTEKLADPVLMDNVVFYAGHASASEYFANDSVRPIQPWDPEATYRAISVALEKHVWHDTAQSRLLNRQVLLGRLSFHREVSRFLSQHEWKPPGRNFVSIPAQHREKWMTNLSDPLYRLVSRSSGNARGGE